MSSLFTKLGLDNGDSPMARRPPGGGHHSANADTHTWLTPPDWLGKLGPFDLDPCACPDPRPWSTAATMWTREDGPLRREWFGRVWLNPPFGPQPLYMNFMDRMATHNRGITLAFSRTDTEIFHKQIFGRAAALLFVCGRPHFFHQDGRRAAHNSGAPVVLAAYGEDDAEHLLNAGLPGKGVRL